jgi:tetratricopeptide (TPR) repeat protein
MNIRASQSNQRGNRYLAGGRDLDRAAKAFREAIDAAPDWSVPWFNLGLVCKRRCEWAESLRCNQEAARLDTSDEATWWNLGIAATALGDWTEARRAWAAYGVKLPPGDGEIAMRLGLTPIRLNPDSHGEVVWCDRIDPARAIIRNVPLPQAAHRYGDLVLHDGAPNGTRFVGEQEVPVFDELQLLIPSRYATFIVNVEAESAEALRGLQRLLAEAELTSEDWGTIRQLCHECSTGRAGAHEFAAEYAPGEATDLGIAAETEAAVQNVLTHWSAAWPQSRVLEVQRALG